MITSLSYQTEIPVAPPTRPNRMLAAGAPLSPPLFSNFVWPLEVDPINHEQNDIYTETRIPDTLLHHFPLPQPQVGHGESTVFDPTAAKKINHNASERDRRKKINSMYALLRSLLPDSDQTKKLSIPNTVSRALKYIPELQKEVERLIQTKEEISSKISKLGDETIHLKDERVDRIRNTSSTVSASPLGDGEVMIQISTVKAKKSSLLCEALQILENDGVRLVNASSFESFRERVFYNLHLQVEGHQKMEIQILRKKIMSLCEKWEEQIP